MKRIPSNRKAMAAIIGAALAIAFSAPALARDDLRNQRHQQEKEPGAEKQLKATKKQAAERKIDRRAVQRERNTRRQDQQRTRTDQRARQRDNARRAMASGNDLDRRSDRGDLERTAAQQRNLARERLRGDRREQALARERTDRRRAEVRRQHEVRERQENRRVQQRRDSDRRHDRRVERREVARHDDRRKVDTAIRDGRRRDAGTATRDSKDHRHGAHRISNDDRQRRIDRHRDRAHDYRRHTGHLEGWQRERARLLRQQRRAAQYRYQQEYYQRLRQQQARLNAYRYDYNNPYFHTPAGFRYHYGGNWHSTNRYGADLLRQAINHGYREGYRAGRADRLDGWRYSYRDTFAYRDASFGYNHYYVGRPDYQHYFRQGFRRGYDDGYGSRYRYGRYNNGNAYMLQNVLSAILNLQTLR